MWATFQVLYFGFKHRLTPPSGDPVVWKDRNERAAETPSPPNYLHSHLIMNNNNNNNTNNNNNNNTERDCKPMLPPPSTPNG